MPLFLLFRKSLDSRKIPQAWKNGYVTPVYKKSSRSSASNYRPVSLTSVVCKLLEKIIRKAVMSHMIENNFLYKTSTVLFLVDPVSHNYFRYWINGLKSWIGEVRSTVCIWISQRLLTVFRT